MFKCNLMNQLDRESQGATIAGPEWDNSTEYPSIDSKELNADLDKCSQLTKQVVTFGALIEPLIAQAETLSETDKATAVRACQDAYKNLHEASIALHNVYTYVNCILSVDGTNASGKELEGKIHVASSKLEQAFNPVSLFLKLTSQDVVDRYLESEVTKPTTYALSQDRKLKDVALSLKEEDLLIGLNVHGPSAWGTLYSNISGALSCALELPDGTTKRVGLAEAASLGLSDDPVMREAAYRASTKAWESQEEACASVLNSLAGWRLDEYQRRSHKKPVHFLDDPLHRSRISRQTLDTMMDVTKEARHLGQKVMQLQAKVLKKAKLAPWDLNAPAPKVADSSWKKPSFDEAIELIINAFNTVNPDMGEFVQHMVDQNWIEGTVGPNKRPGAFCTGFPKSRTPRVYMTYSGGMREVKTLAHELGHAFHNWVMRDMPIQETRYPMTLAETASIFAETVVNHALLAKADGAGDRFNFLWSSADEITGLLINVPARYEFESNFYTQRSQGIFTPAKFKTLMNDAWQEWYGDTLSELNPMFWASKLHFHIPELSFYNFPYTFGYLFALGVYAQKDVLGDDFYSAYVNLLRDTGKMSAEEVAQKHLQADLTKPEFWQNSLKIVAHTVEQFEASTQSIL